VDPKRIIGKNGGPRKRREVADQKNKKMIPGVDVMVTIFCDFRQFSAKQLAFFSKPVPG
jgi:hypothetical protein